MIRRQRRYAPAAVAAGAVALAVALGPARPSDVVPFGAAEAHRLAGPAATTGTPVRVVPGEPPRETGTVAPVLLRIPALAVAAEVESVGVDPGTGELAVPARVDRTGWYRHGPGLAATAGSVVIAGHVDGAEGPGALFRLGELEAGDRITVVGTDGRDRDWRVVAREAYDKTAVPLDRWFARDGALRLTLITCGGPFDPESRRYRDNVAVTAVPA